MSLDDTLRPNCLMVLSQKKLLGYTPICFLASVLDGLSYLHSHTTRRLDGSVLIESKCELHQNVFFSGL